VNEKTLKHGWEPGAPFCSCGQDTVTCQGCGKLACGNTTSYVNGIGNIGPCCAVAYLKALNDELTTAKQTVKNYDKAINHLNKDILVHFAHVLFEDKTCSCSDEVKANFK